MTTPPLAIVQARIGSKRLPGKMLLPLGEYPLVYWAWYSARIAFGTAHTVVAIPASEENDELAQTVEGFGGTVFRWDGPEDDVLGRFYHCAHRYRWHPDSVIVRVTPDDVFKSPTAMVRVANGERLPVEIGAEAFTLAALTEAWQRTAIRDGSGNHTPVEHLTHVFYPVVPAPEAPPGTWTIDTEADYERAQELVATAWSEMKLEHLEGAEA